MVLTGNRFKASVSPNKKFVDIEDRKQFGILSVLKLEDIQALRDLVDTIVESKPPKPFSIKLREKSTRHVITGLSEEDGRELVELLDKLQETMVPV